MLALLSSHMLPTVGLPATKSSKQHLNLGVWKPEKNLCTTVFLLNLFVFSHRQETICWRDDLPCMRKTIHRALWDVLYSNKQKNTDASAKVSSLK